MCVTEYDREASIMRSPCIIRGLSRHGKKARAMEKRIDIQRAVWKFNLFSHEVTGVS